MNYSDKEDYALQSLSAYGDRRAFDKLYCRYYDVLYAKGMQISWDEDMTKDCIQDLFTKLWLGRNKLEGINFFKTYLLKSLIRTLIKQLILKRKNETIEYNGVSLGLTSDAFESSMICEESNLHLKNVLNSLINGLPVRQKEALKLRYYHGLDYAAVAESMAVNYQSVVNHVHKSVQKLRSCEELKKLY